MVLDRDQFGLIVIRFMGDVGADSRLMAGLSNLATGGRSVTARNKFPQSACQAGFRELVWVVPLNARGQHLPWSTNECGIPGAQTKSYTPLMRSVRSIAGPGVNSQSCGVFRPTVRDAGVFWPSTSPRP